MTFFISNCTQNLFAFISHLYFIHGTKTPWKLFDYFLLAYEKATKEQRMRTEISQAKKEANFYIQNVEKGKAIDAMKTRKRKRADQVGLYQACQTYT